MQLWTKVELYDFDRFCKVTDDKIYDSQTKHWLWIVALVPEK